MPNTSEEISIELVPNDPAATWPPCLQVPATQTVNHLIAQLRLERNVAYLMAAEASRRSRQLRRPKASSLPKNAGLISKREAAERLNVGLRTIDRKVKEGALTCYRIGTKGHVRFKAEDVDRLLIPEQNAEQSDESLMDFITNKIGKG